MNISDRIQQLRKAKGISQEELADKIGVSRQAVSKWESEQSAPDIEKIILLSDYFETTTDFLLKGIEPVKEVNKKWNAIIIAIVSTVINAIGLILAIAIWIERQMGYSVGVGLGFMVIGTGLFLMGQFGNTNEKSKGKRFFVVANVWTLLLIPLSCCYNICDGILGGYYWLIAPLPQLGNSFVTYGLCWVLYFVVCIAVDFVMIKRNK